MMTSRDNLPVRNQPRTNRGIWTGAPETFLRLRQSGPHKLFVVGFSVHRLTNIA
jgi:hypothetical protein